MAKSIGPGSNQRNERQVLPGRGLAQRWADQASRALLQRVRKEFNELPGLRLSMAQARLLFDFDPVTCKEVFDELLKSGFLVQAGQETFQAAGVQQPAGVTQQPTDLQVTLDSSLGTDAIIQLLRVLADYFRSCGGAGFEIEFGINDSDHAGDTGESRR